MESPTSTGENGKQTAIPQDKVDEINACTPNQVIKAIGLLQKLDISVEHIANVADAKERVKIHNKTAKGEIKTVDQANGLSEALMTRTRKKCDELIACLEDYTKMYREHNLKQDMAFNKALSNKLCINDLEEECEWYKKQLQGTDCPILVCGESSSGKSSFLNLLMGTKALPAAHMSCTFVVTVIQYGPEQVATVHGYNKDNIKTIKEADPVAFYKAIEEVLFEKGDRTTQSQYRQVDIQVPLSYLKSGIILMDTPGIGENDTVTNVLWDCIKKFNICACIYVVKSDNGTGVYPDRLVTVFDKLKEHDKEQNYLCGFDPESALFVFNKWDLVPEEERDAVLDKAVDVIEETWGQLDRQTQICTMAVTDCQQVFDLGYVSEDFSEFLNKFETLMKRALDNKTKKAFSFLASLSEETLALARLYIKKGNTSEKEFKKQTEEAQKQIGKAKSQFQGKCKDLQTNVPKKERKMFDSMKKFFSSSDKSIGRCPDYVKGRTKWEDLENQISEQVSHRILETLRSWEKKQGRSLVDGFYMEVKEVAEKIYEDAKSKMSSWDKKLLESAMEDASGEKCTSPLAALSYHSDFTGLERFYKEMTIPKRVGLAVSAIFWAPVVLMKKPSMPVFKSIFGSIDATKQAWDHYMDEKKSKKYEKNTVEFMTKKTEKAIELFFSDYESPHALSARSYITQRLQPYRNAIATLQATVTGVVQAYIDQIESVREDHRVKQELKEKYKLVELPAVYLMRKLTSLAHTHRISKIKKPGKRPLLQYNRTDRLSRVNTPLLEIM